MDIQTKDELLEQISLAVEQIQKMFAQRDEAIRDCEETYFLCKCVNEILHHGLKEGLISWATEPSIWPLLEKIMCAKDIEEINMLHLKTNKEKCSTWIRMAVNVNLLGSYISTLHHDKSLLSNHYYDYAFLRDPVFAETVKSLLNYGIANFDFQISVDGRQTPKLDNELKRQEKQISYNNDGAQIYGDDCAKAESANVLRNNDSFNKKKRKKKRSAINTVVISDLDSDASHSESLTNGDSLLDSMKSSEQVVQETNNGDVLDGSDKPLKQCYLVQRSNSDNFRIKNNELTANQDSELDPSVISENLLNHHATAVNGTVTQFYDYKRTCDGDVGNAWNMGETCVGESPGQRETVFGAKKIEQYMFAQISANETRLSDVISTRNGGKMEKFLETSPSTSTPKHEFSAIDFNLDVSKFTGDSCDVNSKQHTLSYHTSEMTKVVTTTETTEIYSTAETFTSELCSTAEISRLQSGVETSEVSSSKLAYSDRETFKADNLKKNDEASISGNAKTSKNLEKNDETIASKDVEKSDETDVSKNLGKNDEASVSKILEKNDEACISKNLKKNVEASVSKILEKNDEASVSKILEKDDEAYVSKILEKNDEACVSKNLKKNVEANVSKNLEKNDEARACETPTSMNFETRAKSSSAQDNQGATDSKDISESLDEEQHNYRVKKVENAEFVSSSYSSSFSEPTDTSYDERDLNFIPGIHGRKIPRHTSSSSCDQKSTLEKSVSFDDNGSFTFDSSHFLDSVSSRPSSLDDGSARFECDVFDGLFDVEEEHFSGPDNFVGLTTSEELEIAIDHYKNIIKTKLEKSVSRDQLVQKLIKLRLRLQQERDISPVVNPKFHKVLSHHFRKEEETTGTKHFCDQCGNMIWTIWQSLFSCNDCGYHCHRKCLEHIQRPCPNRNLSSLSYILDICPDTGLDAQQYRCAECRKTIAASKNGVAEARLCDYTGQYFCDHCHWNDQVCIPARVLRNWDFSHYKVCRQTKQLLDLMKTRPLLNLQQMNAMLFRYVEELREVRKLREDILIMKKYFLTCREALESKLLIQLRKRQHFVDNSDTYSFQDLLDVNNDVLVPEISKIHALFLAHIKSDCELCRARGFICEVCKDSSDVIFAFDPHAVKCSKCGTVLHKVCFKPEDCPKCHRKRRVVAST